VINAVKAAIRLQEVSDDVDVRLEFDQSPYVRNSIRGLVVEGLLGASLTGLMVLIFLRDWRSADCRPQHSFRPAQRGDSSVGHRSNHQHHDSRRTRSRSVSLWTRPPWRSRTFTQMLPDVSAPAPSSRPARAPLWRAPLHVLHSAVFVPSFFMVGVGRQLLCRCLLQSHFDDRFLLLSSTLVPVFSHG
jgi:hypothetical protein